MKQLAEKNQICSKLTAATAQLWHCAMSCTEGFHLCYINKLLGLFFILLET